MEQFPYSFVAHIDCSALLHAITRLSVSEEHQYDDQFLHAILVLCDLSIDMNVI
jgi:hypothetical protein